MLVLFFFKVPLRVGCRECLKYHNITVRYMYVDGFDQSGVIDSIFYIFLHNLNLNLNMIMSAKS